MKNCRKSLFTVLIVLLMVFSFYSSIGAQGTVVLPTLDGKYSFSQLCSGSDNGKRLWISDGYGFGSSPVVLLGMRQGDIDIANGDMDK